jgi:hypothetical protein
MAKKTPPVSKTIKAKSSKAKRVKIKRPSTNTVLGKHPNGRLKTIPKPVTKKCIPKTIASKSISLEEQLVQRNAELAIVNSISQAMAQRLDMPGIIRTVGDKVRDIFSAEVTEILVVKRRTYSRCVFLLSRLLAI